MKDSFLLIDGSAILHRAYHALPPFTTKNGIPTGAVFGFFSMLLKLIQETKPAFLVVAFDTPEPTFRKTLYVGYQAKRPKVSDELATQFGIVHEILEGAKISVFEVPGFEADDVLATLAAKIKKELYSKEKKQEEEKAKIIIVTGDRDLLQLVDEEVNILMPVKGISQMMLFDRNRVREKYLVEPPRIVDLKALAGDASDNYPGVQGIGPKTAAALIQKYGGIENIYRNIKEIESQDKVLAQKLASGFDMASLAKKLATLETDVPLNFDINRCRMEAVNIPSLRASFEKYEFRSLIKRLDEGKQPNNEIEKKKKQNQMKLL